MLDVLSKPIDEIGVAEIRALIDLEVPEGEQIEFKKEPPGEGGKSDPWMDGGKIGNYAKNRILKEVVAFVNAYGGVLLIGIGESDTKPAVATEITPVPRCADLAESLKLMFRDRVEPQLARIDVAGVPTEDDGAGVVIIRVGKSRLAPHRDTRTLICPIRRADRSEEMTMREIQDMTLNVSRGLERLEKRLSERSERFQEEFGRIEAHKDRFGIRLTALPVADEIRIDSVFRQGTIVKKFDMPWRTVARRNDRQELLSWPDLFWPQSWRPLLRGARAQRDTTPGYQPMFGYREIYCDGLVELGFVDAECNFIHPECPLTMFANLAAWANHVREQADLPSVEYALEVETHSLGNAGFVMTRPGRTRPETPRLPNIKFPRYSLNDLQEITDLLGWFHRDFWNSMGKDAENVDFVLPLPDSWTPP